MEDGFQCIVKTSNDYDSFLVDDKLYLKELDGAVCVYSKKGGICRPLFFYHDSLDIKQQSEKYTNWINYYRHIKNGRIKHILFDDLVDCSKPIKALPSTHGSLNEVLVRVENTSYKHLSSYYTMTLTELDQRLLTENAMMEFQPLILIKNGHVMFGGNYYLICRDFAITLVDFRSEHYVLFELAREEKIERVLPKLRSQSPSKILTFGQELDLLIVDGSYVALPDNVTLSHYKKIYIAFTAYGARYSQNAFFATCGDVVDQLDIEVGKWYLEPHGGHGALADAIRAKGVEPVVCECSPKM